jgi:hypothetical protein
MKTATRFAARQAIVTQITTWPDPTPLPTPAHLRMFDPTIGDDDLGAARGILVACGLMGWVLFFALVLLWHWGVL